MGSDCTTIYAFNVEGGPIFEIDNFTGDINAFLSEVNKRSDIVDRAQCFGFVGIVTSVWCPEKV
jgi:hypothetical protein